MEIAGDRWSSGENVGDVTAIFSAFERSRSDEDWLRWVKSLFVSRFEGGTGGSDHRTEITDKSNRRIHIGNHTLLIVSLLEHYSYLMYSARTKVK